MGRQNYVRQLAELERSVEAMGDLVLATVDASLAVLENNDVARAKQLIDDDNHVDRMRHDIEEQSFVLIATQQPAATDLRSIMAASTVAGELERIADYCAGIAKISLTMAQEPGPASVEDIRSMYQVTRDLLKRSLEAFRSRDVEAAAVIWRDDDLVDERYRGVFESQVDDMVAHKQHIRRGTYMLWVAHNFERMADRVTNIAESVAFVATGDVALFRENIRAESVPR